MGQPATRYARSGDVHIAYQVSGDGPIDVLLIPDGMIPIEAMLEEPSFEHFLERLGTFARVIRFDRRGMGLSDPVTIANPPTLEQWMDDAVAVLDATRSPQAALVGMAEGGFVVSVLAATKPERARALVLIHATPGYATPSLPGGQAAETVAWAGMVDEWGDTLRFIQRFAPSAAGDERYREWLSRSMRRSVRPATSRAVYEALFKSDVRSALPAIRVPTLVIHRRGNDYLPVEHSRYLADHIEGARFAEVPGVDHVPYIGDAEPILDEIERFLTGRLRSRETDRVLATVLFTDIVNGTAKAAELGDDSWRRLVEAHHALVRKELARYRGIEVDTAGDGFFATFDGPARAVRCALAIRDAVRLLDIEIRAGIHTGECEIIAGKTGGIAVIIGARVREQARPNEVLVSSTVRDLTAGSGLQFEDRGDRELKGVSDKWRLFAVASPAGPTELL